MTLGFGISGADGIAPPQLAALTTSPHTRAVHMCDTRHEAAAALAEQCGVRKFSTGLEDVDDDPDVDVVLCALPADLHCEWLTKAALAGKHLLNPHSAARINA